MKSESILVLAIVFFLAINAYAGTYSGGDGSAEYPYRIATPNDLNDIGATPDDWDKHFVMVNDINLADYTGTQFNIIGPNSTTPFTGIFDGNNHRISSFTYTDPGAECVGLFGSLGNGGQIKNLGIVDVNICGYRRVGGLLGQNTFGSITNCYVKGSITCGDDSRKVGGMVGNNDGRITDCYTIVSISAGSTSGGIGGLVGMNLNHGVITNSYAIGSISGEDVFVRAGGLVGDNYYGTISHCYAIGSVTGGYGSGVLGGLIGDNDSSTISNCFASEEIHGDDVLGGLVGFNDEGTIVNCYATGGVQGDSIVGGLVGRNWGTVSNCYISGLVDGNDNTGGLLGSHGLTASISASFWDIDTSGTNDGVGNLDPDPAGVAGKTTTEMQTKSTFTDAGWDFVGESVNGPNDIWTIHETEDYPKLVWPLVNFVGWYEVDFVDYAFFANRWMDTNCGDANDCEGTDLDFSDAVDANDLKIFCDHWLEGTEP